MLEKKKKLGKKQLKEDKLVTYYSKSLEYFEDYQKQILIAVGIVIVVIAAIVYFANQSQLTELEASAQLAKVSDIYHSGNFEMAIAGIPQNNTPSLVEIVENYGGSPSGEIAKVYLADSYFYLDEYDKAIEYYEDYSGDIKLYEAAAIAGLGACYAAKEDYEKAGEHYREAAFVYETNPLNSGYLLDGAINFIEAKEYEEAKSLIETLKEKYPGSKEASESERYLAWIEINSQS